MEVVGGVASIMTLIKTAGVLAQVSKELVLRWRDAPHVIQTLAARLSLLAAELQSIERATSTSHPVLTDAIIRQSLGDLLTDVRKRLEKLESLHFRLEQSKPLHQKIRWTVKDADSVEKMLSKTSEVEQRLANLMTLISLKAQTPILEGLDRIEQMVSTLVVSLPASNSTHMSPTPSAFRCPAQRTRSTAAVRRKVASSTVLDKSWEPWGLRGRQTKTRSGFHNDHKISFSVTVPFARILGNYASIGSLSLQSTPLCWGFLTLRYPSYFAVARVIDNNHPFIQACEEGDIENLRLMLRSGEGRPTDVTVNGFTPLYSAVCTGNIEVMKELLDCGTDVNMSSNVRTMITALEYALIFKDSDTIRFLLQRGASVDGRFLGGIRSSALCWARPDYATAYSSMDIFKLIMEDESLELFEQECDGYGAPSLLERVALSATGAQINQLISFGADVHLGVWYGRAAIHTAAYEGNYSAYSALMSYYDITFFERSHQLSLDVLLATLAGKAALLASPPQGTAPSKQWSYTHRPRYHDWILLDLFHRGVKPGARIDLRDWDHFYASPSIRGLELDMNELAASYGPEIEAWYLAIRDFSLSPSAWSDVDYLHEQTAVGSDDAGFV